MTSSEFDIQLAKQKPLNILIAEDEEINRIFLSLVLKKLGYIPKMATNGNEAKEMMRNEYFDLVFMDVTMPGTNGIDCTQFLRKDLRNHNTIVVAMTAHALSGDRERCLASGMNHYLSKPIKPADIVDLLKQL